MELYLDREFVQNFWSFKPIKKSIWENFEKEFLIKIRNFKLITNYMSHEDMCENENDFFFIDLFADKVNGVEFVGEKKKKDWISESLLISGGYKIFLVELDDLEIEYYKNITGYEFISIKKLEEIWEKYLVKEITKSIDILPNPRDSDLFNGWSDLALISKSPTNSIIIVDKYILGDLSKQKIEENLIPALKMIIPKGYLGRLDILIISEEIKSAERGKTVQKRAMEVHELLKVSFTMFPNIDIRFKILIHDKAFYTKESMDIHDRIIYTNYFTVECGKGFNLFSGNNRICANSKVEIHFNFQPYFIKVLPRHLESLRKYIERFSKVEVLDKFKYYPDVECRLLS